MTAVAKKTTRNRQSNIDCSKSDAPSRSEYLNQLFDNLPKLLKPIEAAEASRYDILTVYDWNRRPERYGIDPNVMFVRGRKRGFKVFRDALKAYMLSRN